MLNRLVWLHVGSVQGFVVLPLVLGAQKSNVLLISPTVQQLHVRDVQSKLWSNEMLLVKNMQQLRVRGVQSKQWSNEMLLGNETLLLARKSEQIALTSNTMLIEH